MVKIRLQKIGTKNSSKFRIVISEKKIKRGGKFIENIGFYNPGHSDLTKKEFFFLKNRYLFWLKRGASTSTTVGNLITKLLNLVKN